MRRIKVELTNSQVSAIQNAISVCASDYDSSFYDDLRKVKKLLKDLDAVSLKLSNAVHKAMDDEEK